MDEHYSKDSKVPMIDLEVFAKEHIKNLEEQKFNIEMAKLQEELDQLEPGKYNSDRNLLSTPKLNIKYMEKSPQDDSLKY